MSPRMLDLIQRFDVDECAKYPLGHRDGPTEATQIKGTRSNDTEDGSVGTDIPDTAIEDGSVGTDIRDMAIEDDSTADTADRRETGRGATRGLRSRPATEVRNLRVEITNYDAESQALAVTPDRAYESDGPMQAAS